MLIDDELYSSHPYAFVKPEHHKYAYVDQNQVSHFPETISAIYILLGIFLCSYIIVSLPVFIERIK